MWPFRSKRLPDHSAIKQRLSNTPDYWQIEQKARHLVFWYFSPPPSNDLPIGNEGFMTGFTKHGFVLWKKNDGPQSFPIPLLHKLHSVPQARVCGDLHFVPPAGIISLDKAMRNGVEFHRTRISIVVPYEEVSEKTVAQDGRFITETNYSNPKHYVYQAFMYVGLKSFWEEQLDGGYTFSPCRRYNMPKLGDFYKWSAEEAA